jgi:N-formylglutamate deformylase
MKKLPFIISVPHCSGKVPLGLRSALDLTEEEIDESRDVGTAEIFGSLPSRITLCAQWSRLVVDLNRDSERRDRKGVVPLVDYNGRVLYKPGSVPDEQEIRSRTDRYYQSYHNSLKESLRDPEVRGVIDCHSLYEIAPVEAPDAGDKRKDIVLGNNGDSKGNELSGMGKPTAPAETVQMLKRVFQKYGFSVSVNNPYRGGFITTHYGGRFPGNDRIFMQIEINQGLYLNGITKQVVESRIKDVRKRVHKVFDFL